MPYLTLTLTEREHEPMPPIPRYKSLAYIAYPSLLAAPIAARTQFDERRQHVL